MVETFLAQIPAFPQQWGWIEIPTPKSGAMIAGISPHKGGSQPPPHPPRVRGHFYAISTPAPASVNSPSFWLLLSHNKNTREEINITFDFLVGNPPYQIESAGNKIMDKPIYHHYMSATYEIADKVMLVTPGRFLFAAGATPKEFNERMLSDEHLKVEYYEQNSNVMFPGTDIKGGVVITYHDKTKTFVPIETFTAYPELNSIRQKVTSADDFVSLSEVMYIQNCFGLEVLLNDHPEYKPLIGSDGRERRITSSIFRMVDVFRDIREHDDDICILGIIGNKRIRKYISQKYVADNGNLHKYKVILPKNNGSGAIGEVLATPLIGEPLIGFSQSFISIGAFDNTREAEACLKYIKTKFARAMLGILKVTQNGSRNVYKYVPLQNFTSLSDIDWSLSVPDIDRQLYEKYSLDPQEIEFIETKVKEMP